VELCRRFGDDDTTMSVSTVASRGADAFDRHESYSIYRQPFPFERANRFSNQLRWARWLTSRRSPQFDVLHCGNIRPVGYAVRWAHRKQRTPYLVYVNGGDLLRERRKAERSAVKRQTAQWIFGQAAGKNAASRPGTDNDIVEGRHAASPGRALSLASGAPRWNDVIQ